MSLKHNDEGGAHPVVIGRSEECGRGDHRTAERRRESRGRKQLGVRLFSRFPMTQWEMVASIAVFLLFSAGPHLVYSIMPSAEFDKILRLPISEIISQCM